MIGKRISYLRGEVERFGTIWKPCGYPGWYVVKWTGTGFTDVACVEQITGVEE